MPLLKKISEKTCFQGQINMKDVFLVLTRPLWKFKLKVNDL